MELPILSLLILEHWERTFLSRKYRFTSTCKLELLGFGLSQAVDAIVVESAEL